MNDLHPMSDEDMARHEAAARHLQSVDHGASIDVQKFFISPAEVLLDLRAQGRCTHHVEGFDE